MELVTQIFQTCIIPLLGLLTAFFIRWMNNKTAELKLKIGNDYADSYINFANDIITSCVVTTNQVYVDTLKKQGKFDKDAQIVAFEATRDAILMCLTEEAQEVLTQVYGDLNKYLEVKIEQAVRENK